VEKQKYLSLSGNRTQYHPANSLVAKPTELFRPPFTLTCITVRRHRNGCSARNCPSTCTRGEWLPRARLVAHFLFIFQLGFSPLAPRPPQAPLSIDAIVPHFLQLLHFLFSFASSFPHFKKWKILSFRNKETSGLGLEGQFFRT
jgi:hypothetical protein